MYWVISGQAELAAEVTAENVKLWKIDGSYSYSINNRSCIPRIFQGCTDLQILTDIPVDNAISYLDTSFRYSMAMQLSIVALDVNEDIDNSIDAAKCIDQYLDDFIYQQLVDSKDLYKYNITLRPIDDYTDDVHVTITKLHKMFAEMATT